MILTIALDSPFETQQTSSELLVAHQDNVGKLCIILYKSDGIFLKDLIYSLRNHKDSNLCSTVNSIDNVSVCQGQLVV